MPNAMPNATPIATEDLLLSLAELAATPRPRALVGGKAMSLARLMAAGVPVPDGLILTTRVAALPADQQDAVLQVLADRARALGGPLAVRSSATIEDDVASAAPGIFLSRLHVTPDAAIDAVRAVWASAHAPLVQAYARARGLDRIHMAVIVQRQVPGHAAGVAYTRPPGRPDAPEMIIETHAGAGSPARSIRVPRPPASPPAPGPLPLDSATLARLIHTVSLAEAALEGAAGDASPPARARDHILEGAAGDASPLATASRGADVEWVAGPTGVWIVQARPIVHPPAAPAPAFPEALIRFSREQPALVWRWDVSHNPDPLSPAQTGLVERMDRAGLVRYRMRVVGGYLYVASPPAPAPEAPREHSAESLRRRFEGTWLPTLEAALAAAEAPDAGLDHVLAAYERFYAVYATELTDWVARARRALPAFLRTHGVAAADHGPDDDDAEALAGDLLDDRSPARLETLIARVAHGQDSFDALMAAAGPMSPAWDVAVPTFAETPALLHRAVAAAAGRAAQGEPRARAAEDRVRARLDPGTHEAFARCLALARTARDIGERDDRLYARAQAAVRHALLRLARRWALPDPDDIFFVPLDLVLARAGEPGPPDAATLRRLARAGRAVRERQRAWIMPLAFAGGRVIEPPGLAASPGPDPARAPAPDGNTWRGRGTGGRARGTAVRLIDLGDIATLAPDLGPDPILVVPAITPAMAVLLPHVVAVVAQHGGLLGHGAAMARELGLPCVVDCARAWHDLRTGDPLWVDGEAGLVARTGG